MIETTPDSGARALPPAIEAEPFGTPEFGRAVTLRAEPCRPHELFACLHSDFESHIHYLLPAFRFVHAALASPTLPPPWDEPSLAEGGLDEARLEALIRWARDGFDAPPAAFAAPWPVRVCAEFAPSGLSDGAWLRGSMFANAIETEINMSLLEQLMLRFGDPSSNEAYARRYSALLESLALPARSFTHPDLSAADDVSYEHALLGLCLGFFPTRFGPETLGFNLWMACVGPCPLLERLLPALRSRGASLRYFDCRDPRLPALARHAVLCALRDDPALAPRIARGFAAAHLSQQRWERAMLGRNVPLTAADFAREHARAPRAAGLERSPDATPSAAVALKARVPLQGLYTPPQDPDSLAQFAHQRYGSLSLNDLYFCCANSDRHPAVHLFARAFVSGVLARLDRALGSDPRLGAQTAPPYSERCIAELVAAQHEKNVRSRKHDAGGAAAASSDAAPAGGIAPGSGDDDVSNYITAIFDGCWLQGFADVARADFEEYGWLFRIYASEHGDGKLDWNHSRIFRFAFAKLGPRVLLPKTDRAMYDVFNVAVGSLAKLAIALNTRHFMPEILGLNLGIEASGVGGGFMDTWKEAEQQGDHWRALAARLHNSIDNYADGHTKWSLAAVQAYMRRVKDTAPLEVESTWLRIWRQWRLHDILEHGTQSERAALAEHFDLTSLSLS